MRKVLGFIVASLIFVSLPGYANAATEEVDWKTEIETTDEDVLDELFEDEYEDPKTLYTTTYLNMRPYPNTNSEVERVLPINFQVKAVSEYNGWTRIVYKDKYFYVWNEYLSSEKTLKSLGIFKLTAYCNCPICSGEWAWGPTSSGSMPVAGRTVAMYGLPLGTKVLINGHEYVIEDRGTPYSHIDVYHNTHEEALDFGVQYAEVYLIN